ncbi:hypothetical protein HBI56_117770 [Parastagonospora nodorum]|nr:hypothetical protein HBI56_117770 [Parastagonospora nodorum]
MKTTTTILYLNNIMLEAALNLTLDNCRIKELEARHSLLNLSVYDLVEEFARYRLELEAQLRKASEEEELAKTKKEKREKEAREREAELDSLLDSNDYCLDSSLDIDPEDNLEDKEERLKALLNAKMRDSLSARNKRIMKLLARAYILYFKELLSDNSRIFASVIGITRTRAIKNEVVAIDPANSILCDLSDLLVVRFCIFSNSALENIGILTNKKVIIAEANMPAVHSKATKHCLALLTVFDEFYNCKLEGTIIAKFYKDL